MVKNLDETGKYLRKLFGFECWYRDESKKTLVVESEYVHFFVEEYGSKTSLIEKQHISFQVKSIRHVEEELKRNGIIDYKMGEVTFFRNRNYKWCEWTDSNGIRFECIEEIVKK